MPDKKLKVTGLRVSSTEESGEYRLSWNPITEKRNNVYFIELNTTMPLDNNAWYPSKPRSTKARKITITGLKPGQLYWVRIIAVVNKIEGPPSDPQVFIAP